MREIVFLILLFFATTIVLSYSSENNTSGLDETIQAGAEYGDTVIFSFRGRITHQWVQADSTDAVEKERRKNITETAPLGTIRVFVNSITTEIDYAWNGKQMSSHELQANPPSNGSVTIQDFHYVFDGEKTCLLQKFSSGSDSPETQGIIYPGNHINYDMFSPLYWGMSIRGMPIASFIRGGKSSEKAGLYDEVFFVKDETRGGITCKVFRALISEIGDTLTVWLAPEYQYRPLYLEEKTGTFFSSTSTRFKKYDDFWFPELICTHAYRVTEGTGEKKPFYIDTIKVAEDCNINTVLPDSLFSFRFPPGIRVADERIGEQYRSK